MVNYCDPISQATTREDISKDCSPITDSGGAFPQTNFFLQLLSDIQTVRERDSSSKNWLEALLCSSGLHALIFHRAAHWLYCRQIPFLPRLISHIGRFFTKIEIHPGAQIGEKVFIAHGAGVVIGETAIVGNGTLIYQGVTLGGTGKEIGKRHPTLGKNVVVGAEAKILGNIHIGDNVRIEAASVVLEDVLENSIVVGIPGRAINITTLIEGKLEHKFPEDSSAQAIQTLFKRNKLLETEIESLKSGANLSLPQAEKASIDNF
jgi:serine O-acetyltransferase